MPSSYTFTSASLSLRSATRLGPSLVRVAFTQPPLRINPAGATDALNISNWSFSGPAVVTVASVAAVAADSQSVDITVNQTLSNGSWTVTVVNVMTAGGASLVAPTSASFAVADLETNLVAGAEGESAFSVIRKHLNQALAGPNWDALIAALSSADEYVWSLASAVFDQMFKSTASGKYLDILAANDGNSRPASTGMDDDAFRELAIELATGRVTYNSILRILQSFFGREALRAYVDTAVGPFVLVDGYTVIFDFEGTVYTYEVDSRAFRTVNTATATEVAVALTVYFQHQNIGALASVVTDSVTGLQKVRVYSPSLGLRSKLTVTGGTGKAALGFDSLTHTVQNGERTVAVSQTTDGVLDVVVPAVASVTRTAETGAYVFGNTPVEITALSRRNGIVTVQTAAAHSLTAGQSVFIDGYQQGRGRAWMDAAAAGVLGGGWTHGLASTDNISGSVGDVSTNEAGKIVRSNGAIVIFGGYNSSNVLQGLTVNVSTPSTSIIASGTPANGATQTAYTITSLGSMVVPRRQMGYSVLNGPLTDSVFVTGGESTFGSNTAVATTEKLTGSAWAATSSMATARTYHAQVTLDNGNVLVAGGYTGTLGPATANCELYQPLLDSWIPAASMTKARAQFSMFKMSDGKVVAIGGRATSGEKLAGCELYNPATNTWSTITEMCFPEDTYFSAVAIGNDQILVAQEDTLETQIYSYSTNTWRRGPAMPYLAGLRVVSLAKLGSRLYATQVFSDYSKMYWLDLNEMVWNIVPTTARSIGRSLIVANDKIVLLGGYGFVGGGPATRYFDAVVGNDTKSSPKEINGLYKIASIVSPTAFTYLTPTTTFTDMFGGDGIQVPAGNTFANGWSVGIADENPEYTLATAKTGDGLYVLDPDSVTYKAGDSVTSVVLTEGNTYGTLDIGSTANFPDTEGWVVLGLGHSYESKPLKYLEKISGTQLLMEGFTANQTWPAGISVTRIEIEPTTTIDKALWVTGSLAARVVAEYNVRESVAGDVTLNWSVIYPGDRGLGGEGQSNTDATDVWGSES